MGHSILMSRHLTLDMTSMRATGMQTTDMTIVAHVTMSQAVTIEGEVAVEPVDLMLVILSMN